MLTYSTGVPCHKNAGQQTIHDKVATLQLTRTTLWIIISVAL